MIIGLTKQKIIKHCTMISEHEHETQLINLEWKRRRVMHQDVIYRGRFNWIQTVTGVFQNNYVDRIKRSNHPLLPPPFIINLVLPTLANLFQNEAILKMEVFWQTCMYFQWIGNISEFGTIFFIMFLLPATVCSLEELTWSMVIVKGWRRRLFWPMHREGIDRDTL